MNEPWTVHVLKDKRNLDIVVMPGKVALDIGLNVAPHDEHDLINAGSYCIHDGEVEEGLTVRPDLRQLFGPAEARAQAGSHHNKSKTHVVSLDAAS